MGEHYQLEERWHRLLRMTRRFPSVNQHGGKEHAALAFADSTVHIWDHLDQVSSTDEQTQFSSSVTWGQCLVLLAWSNFE